MKIKGLIVIVLMMIFDMAVAQNTMAKGEVKIEKDPLVDTLLSYHISRNMHEVASPDHDGLSGYRIQIFFDSGNNSRENAREVIEAFEEEYPDIGVYLTFREPYYRVRVGDFRRKIEALGFLQRIKRDYPNAWVIKDMINFPVIYEKPKHIEYDQ